MKLNFVGVQELVSRYVRAIIKLSQEQKCLEDVYRDFKKLEQAFAVSGTSLDIVATNAISQSMRVEIVEKLGKLLKLHDISNKFLMTLLENGRFALAAHCVKFFFMEYNNLHGVKEVLVVSASIIPVEEQKKIEKKLTKTMGVKIECSYEIDESLISGLRVKIDAITYDFTAKARLNFILQNSMDGINNIDL